jgi:hypothetical protein
VSIASTATVLEDTWDDHDEAHAPFWLTFNRALDHDADAFPNEALLERRLGELQALEASNSPLFWLTVARLTELALKLAGDYADVCEFQAAGDLLVNPRRIDVYGRGCPTPIRKHRHGSLIKQFNDAIGNADPIAWLKQHTLLQIRTPALLPQLNRMLASSGVMAVDYVASIDRRMHCVADAIAFLNAWGISDYADLQRQWAAADAGDRRLVTTHLCRFTLHRFAALGQDIARWLRDGDRYSQFLRSSKNGPEALQPRPNDAASHCCVQPC